MPTLFSMLALVFSSTLLIADGDSDDYFEISSPTCIQGTITVVINWKHSTAANEILKDANLLNNLVLEVEDSSLTPLIKANHTFTLPGSTTGNVEHQFSLVYTLNDNRNFSLKTSKILCGGGTQANAGASAGNEAGTGTNSNNQTSTSSSRTRNPNRDFSQVTLSCTTGGKIRVDTFLSTLLSDSPADFKDVKVEIIDGTKSIEIFSLNNQDRQYFGTSKAVPKASTYVAELSYVYEPSLGPPDGRTYIRQPETVECGPDVAQSNDNSSPNSWELDFQGGLCSSSQLGRTEFQLFFTPRNFSLNYQNITDYYGTHGSRRVACSRSLNGNKLTCVFHTLENYVEPVSIKDFMAVVEFTNGLRVIRDGNLPSLTCDNSLVNLDEKQETTIFAHNKCERWSSIPAQVIVRKPNGIIDTHNLQMTNSQYTKITKLPFIVEAWGHVRNPNNPCEFAGIKQVGNTITIFFADKY